MNHQHFVSPMCSGTQSVTNRSSISLICYKCTLFFISLSSSHLRQCTHLPPSSPGGRSPSLEVSLNIDGVPSVGSSIRMYVTVKNQSSNPRVLMEHLNAQMKEYNSGPKESFWKIHKEVHIQPHEGKEACNSLNTKTFRFTSAMSMYSPWHCISFFALLTVLALSHVHYCLINQTSTEP